MANGSFTWVVNLVWQAVPESMTYFDLDASDMDVVNQKFVAQVNTLVPPDDQSKWQNLVLTVSSFDDLVSNLNALLKNEFHPPSGTELSTAEIAIIWRPIPPNGHDVWRSLMLKDLGAMSPRQWTFTVSHAGASYTARMGLVYECLHARVP